MTWTVDPETGELYDPNGNLVTTLDGDNGSYKLPTAAQTWALSQLRSMSMADLTTDKLADFAQIFAGDVEFDR